MESKKSGGDAERQGVSIHEAEMPQSINMFKFAQSRAREVEVVMKMIEKKAPKKATQQLPRHMRRRASSYNPKRVPKRLRERAVREIETNKVKVPKRPSRKFRRRPKNLLDEYNRRKRKYKWLETHIWFAKRFKMKEIWGYKLPLHSNDKTFRASYRASFRHCLINDISYYGCLELEGPEDTILQGLSTLTSPDIGLTFKAKTLLSGSREGQTILYHQNTYPFRAIGPAQFLWKPMLDNTETGNIRHLWIWVHPLMYDELVEELQSVFGFVMTTHTVISEHDDVNNCIEPRPFEEEMEVNGGIQETFFLGKDGVTMYLLRDSLVRLRLTGALAQTVLTSALEPVPQMQENPDRKQELRWWEEYLLSEKCKQATYEQCSLWKELRSKSFEFLPPGTVFGLIVLDPRLRLPKKKIGVTYRDDSCGDKSSPCMISELPQNLAYSPIWSENVRKTVIQTMMSQNEINTLRSQLLVPGTPLELNERESRIPLLVVKQAGIQDVESPSYGYNSSWDVIIPSGWAVAFLIAFVYRGARPGGLREMETVAREGITPIYPNHFPDSVGGQKIAITQWQQRLQEHLRYPPAKRPSFEKLGIVSPFYPQWHQLATDWKNEASTIGCIGIDEDVISPECSDVSVTRNRKVIKQLQKAFHMTSCDVKVKVAKHSASQKSVHDSVHILERFEHALEVVKYFTPAQLKLSLVTVQVQVIGKGTPVQFSLICIPLESDLKNLAEDESFTGPEEPVNKAFAKEKKAKKKEKQEKGKQELPLIPPSVENVRNSCSREVLGFVETGDYSFFQSSGSGIGFCSLIGLVCFLKACAEKDRAPLVLFRNQQSRKYYFATIWPVMPF